MRIHPELFSYSFNFSYLIIIANFSYYITSFLQLLDQVMKHLKIEIMLKPVSLDILFFLLIHFPFDLNVSFFYS